MTTPAGSGMCPRINPGQDQHDRENDQETHRSTAQLFPRFLSFDLHIANRAKPKKHGGFPRRNNRFLNCRLPRLSREQISPSMTALAFGSAAAMDSANAENEANGCPLRELS